MKFQILFSALFLAACAGTAPMQTASTVPGQLTTQSDFAEISGKRLLLNDDDYVIISANGGLGGEFNDVETVGTWVLKDGYFCRTLTAGPSGPSPEDCQLIVRRGNQLEITRDRGNGNSFIYAIEG